MKKIIFLIVVISLLPFLTGDFGKIYQPSNFQIFLISFVNYLILNFWSYLLIAAVIFLQGTVLFFRNTDKSNSRIYYRAVIFGALVGIVCASYFSITFGVLMGVGVAGAIGMFASETSICLVPMIIVFIIGMSFISKEHVLFNFVFVYTLCAIDFWFLRWVWKKIVFPDKKGERIFLSDFSFKKLRKENG